MYVYENLQMRSLWIFVFGFT